HGVPDGWKLFAGQLPAPSHVSATSQSPAEARHTVVVGSGFVWHDPVALHVSGLSQTVSELLPHGVPDGWKPFAGQLPAPSHISATSQSPAAARHTVVVGSGFV